MVKHIQGDCVLRMGVLRMGFRFGIAPTVALIACATFADARDYAPHIMYVFPAGGQRGTTVEGVMTRGRGLEGTSEIRISGDGVSAHVESIEKPDSRLMQRSKNRQDQAENPNVVKFSVAIAADAEPGPRDLWLISPKGPSNRMRFVVGQVEEVVEADVATEIDQPQQIESLPVVVNGQYNQGDRDVYRFHARAGETIVCAVQGRRLKPYIPDAVPGWFQPCLTLRDSTGSELRFADDWRFHPDPVLLFDVQRDGDYELEIRDALYRGREDLVYRLTIGAVPFITHVFPLGGRRGEEVSVQLHGVNLPVTTTRLSVPLDAPTLELQVTRDDLLSNSVPFAAGDDVEITETEPNDLPSRANRIELPTVINGRIDQSKDVDHFTFSGKKGQVVVCDLLGRRLESPIDSIIEILDEKGRRIAFADDTVDPSAGLITHHADSYLRHRIAENGEYIVRVRDVQNHGGNEFGYRLTIAPPRPDFDLRVFPANLSVAPGASAIAKVKAYRRDGFREPIDVRIAGLPAGFLVTPTVVEAGQRETHFTITAPADAALGMISPNVTGTAVISRRSRPGQGKPSPVNVTLERQAVPAEELMQAFYYWHDVPTDDYLVSVVKARTFSLSLGEATTAVHEIRQNGKLPLVVHVTRDAMQVAVEQAQARLEAATAVAEQARQELAKARQRTVAEKPAGPTGKRVDGKTPRRSRNATDQAGRTNERTRRPGSSRFAPRVPGASARIAALTSAVQAANAAVNTANREVENARAAIKAPITLSAVSPPPGIVVKPVRIPGDQSEGTIVLAVSSKANPGARYNITITGTIRIAGEAITGAAPAVPIRVVEAGE